MRILHGLEKRLATAPGQFALDRFGDEMAAVSLEQVDFFHQVR
jgi:hypothetical protein